MGSCMGKIGHNNGSENQQHGTNVEPKEIKYKIVLVGESDVGKSSLIGQYTTGQFRADVAEFVDKDININGKLIKITIFDTQGMEKFKTITSSFYDGSGGIVLVYDLTSRPSFDVLEQWFQECDRYAVDAEILLLGNKLDLEKQRQVPKESLEEIAKQHGRAYQEVSAKTGEGVTEAFIKLVKIIIGQDKLMESGDDDHEDEHQDDDDEESGKSKKKK